MSDFASVEWEDEAASEEWDVEDALAQALLGSGDHNTSLPMQEDEESERLVSFLHARIFPPDKSHLADKKQHRVHPRPQMLTRLHAKHHRSATAAAGASQSSKQSSLSPEKLADMLQRFRLQEDSRVRRRTLLQQRLAQVDTSQDVTSPTLSPRSRELTRHLPRFLERQEQDMQRRQRYESYRRDDKQEHRMECRQSCPCLCGSETGDHTPSCTRFMELCSQTTKTKVSMRRSIDDMLAFHEEKQRRQHARVAIKRAQEAQQMTFAPEINSKSTKIYQEMIKRQSISGSASPPRHSTVLSPRPKPRNAVKQHQSRVTPGSRNSRRLSSVLMRRSSLQLIPRATFSEARPATKLEEPQQNPEKAACPQMSGLAVPWTNVVFNKLNTGFVLESFDHPFNIDV